MSNTAKRARVSFQVVPPACLPLIFGCLKLNEFASCRRVCSEWSSASAAWSHLSLMDRHAQKLVGVCVTASVHAIEVDEDTTPRLPAETFKKVHTLDLHLICMRGVYDWGEELWTELPDLEVVHVQVGGVQKVYRRKFAEQHRIKSCRFTRVTPLSDSLFRGECLQTLEFIDVNMLKDSFSFIPDKVLSCPTIVNLALRDCQITAADLQSFMERSVAANRKWVSLDFVSRYMCGEDFGALLKTNLFRRFVQGLETFKFNYHASPEVLDALPSTSLKNLEIEDVHPPSNEVFAHIPPKVERLLIGSKLYGWWTAAELDWFQKLGGHPLKELVVQDMMGLGSLNVARVCEALPALERLVLREMSKRKYTVTRDLLAETRPRLLVVGLDLKD